MQSTKTIFEKYKTWQNLISDQPRVPAGKRRGAGPPGGGTELIPVTLAKTDTKAVLIAGPIILAFASGTGGAAKRAAAKTTCAAAIEGGKRTVTGGAENVVAGLGAPILAPALTTI